MAKKKDFSNIGKEKVLNDIAIATGAAEAEAPAEESTTEKEREKLERLETMKTRGHKGEKLPRINFAFTPSNHKYITTMAKVNGKSMAEFLNDIIKREAEQDEKYQQIKEILGE